MEKNGYKEKDTASEGIHEEVVLALACMLVDAINEDHLIDIIQSPRGRELASRSAVTGLQRLFPQENDVRL